MAPHRSRPKWPRCQEHNHSHRGTGAPSFQFHIARLRHYLSVVKVAREKARHRLCRTPFIGHSPGRAAIPQPCIRDRPPHSASGFEVRQYKLLYKLLYKSLHARISLNTFPDLKSTRAQKGVYM